MLKHLNPVETTPARVVVLGTRGSVGAALASLLSERRVATLLLGRHELDLTVADAHLRLAAKLRPDDALVLVSAVAPCKNASTLVENVKMMSTVCSALTQSSVCHVVYISSDAVYRDSAEPLTENSCAEPQSLHGAMHLARELMLKSTVNAPVAILRPSLLFGPTDTHDGYGPNRFLRLASTRENIVLFGEGEERRDHVVITDLAQLVFRVLMRRSVGTLNIATGEIISFRTIAEEIAGWFGVEIYETPRNGPMPHAGYRPFNIAACRASFPDFHYTPLNEALRRTAAARYGKAS
jgi:UDP-glucose 4-epimerase